MFLANSFVDDVFLADMFLVNRFVGDVFVADMYMADIFLVDRFMADTFCGSKLQSNLKTQANFCDLTHRSCVPYVVIHHGLNLGYY